MSTKPMYWLSPVAISWKDSKGKRKFKTCSGLADPRDIRKFKKRLPKLTDIHRFLSDDATAYNIIIAKEQLRTAKRHCIQLTDPNYYQEHAVKAEKIVNEAIKKAVDAVGIKETGDLLKKYYPSNNILSDRFHEITGTTKQNYHEVTNEHIIEV